MKKQCIQTLSALALAATAVLGAQTSAQAATANSADIPVNLTVNAPTCTISNGNASISLPAVSSQTTTVNQWITANGITTTGQTTGGLTSAALNQTATVSCNLASTAITSFVVQPGASSVLVSGQTGAEYLVDSATPTPAKAGGTMSMGFEQVSVNGTATPYAYLTSAGIIQPYAPATPFTTSATLTGGYSTATVVWRPQFFGGSSAVAIGNPTGGAFVGHAQIVANY